MARQKAKPKSAKRTSAKKSPRGRATRPTRAHAAVDAPRSGPLVSSVTIEAQANAFLEAFSKIGIVTTAAEMVGVDRKRHYEWLVDERLPDYAARFEEARLKAIDRIERAVIERGVYGWDETTVEKNGKGQIVSTKTVHKTSDRMLELAVKAKKPEYREKTQLEHVGSGGGPIQVLTASLSNEEILKRLDAAKQVIEASLVATPPPELPAAPDDPVEAAKRAYAEEVARRGNGNGHP